MARFIAKNQDGFVQLVLDAEDGEELTERQVAAHAALAQAVALEGISNYLCEIEATLGSIAIRL